MAAEAVTAVRRAEAAEAAVRAAADFGKCVEAIDIFWKIWYNTSEKTCLQGFLSAVFKL